MAFKKDDVIIIEPKEIFVGKKDAAVTLIEFGEYESEECAKANEIVKQLLEEYEGKGYATEAAMALMKYFEEVKGQKEFIGLTHPDNERSIKMMRRLGFREEGERAVLGFTPDGKAVFPLCWSRGLEGELPRSVTVTDE